MRLDSSGGPRYLLTFSFERRFGSVERKIYEEVCVPTKIVLSESVSVKVEISSIKILEKDCLKTFCYV